jgi:hypothetical protein
MRVCINLFVGVESTLRLKISRQAVHKLQSPNCYELVTPVS